MLEALKKHVIKPLEKEFPTPMGETGFANGTIHGFLRYSCSEAFKQKTSVAKCCSTTTWNGRSKNERRGQDLNLRTGRTRSPI